MSELCPFHRGQNANMHACEAAIAAFEATQDEMFLQRALTIARRVTVELRSQTQGIIWEHYKGLDVRNLYRE